jgi:hypothetical protein
VLRECLYGFSFQLKIERALLRTCHGRFCRAHLICGSATCHVIASLNGVENLPQLHVPKLQGRVRKWMSKTERRARVLGFSYLANTPTRSEGREREREREGGGGGREGRERAHGCHSRRHTTRSPAMVEVQSSLPSGRKERANTSLLCTKFSLF